MRAWPVNMGRRDALIRIAHLLCELHARLATVDLADAGDFALPATQTDLGDTIGLSAVHVNRCIASLEAEGLASLRKGRAFNPDICRLRALCRFDPGDLRLGPDGPGATPSGRDSTPVSCDVGDEP